MLSRCQAHRPRLSAALLRDTLPKSGLYEVSHWQTWASRALASLSTQEHTLQCFLWRAVVLNLWPILRQQGPVFRLCLCKLHDGAAHGLRCAMAEVGGGVTHELYRHRRRLRPVLGLLLQHACMPMQCILARSCYHAVMPHRRISVEAVLYLSVVHLPQQGTAQGRC